MKILFGMPDVTHRELANLEIEGIKAIIPNCQTIHYGPINSKRGFLNRILLTIKNALSIKKVLKNGNFDLLFLNTTFDFNGVIRDSITLFILNPQGTKVFMKFHGSDPALLDSLYGFRRKLSTWLLSRVHGIGVLSSEEKKKFIEKGFQEKKIFVVKNPVNPIIYSRDEKFKTKMELPSKTFIFIFIARFLPFKGLMDVLKALKEVRKEMPNIHLFCIGDGPQMNEAQQFIIQNNLNSFVSFTGFIPEIDTRAYYANADALIFPSSHEGFPMAVFQSLAAGVPIITTRIAASADYLKEPDNVLWVETHSPDQIRESMIRLLKNDALVNRMKSNNAILAHKFTNDKNALEYLGIFEELVKK